MPYLYNCWYMAGWAAEVDSSLLSRRLLDRPVVLFRDAGGSARALADSCPHRFVPLSLGRLVDGAVECAYHGLRFGADGKCVHSPQGEVPKGAAVAAYPLVERHGILWIWMGNEDPDDTLIPDYSCNDPELHYLAGGYLLMETDYRFGTDNILDLSHVHFMHRDSLAKNIAGYSREESEVRQVGEEVWSHRVYREVPASSLPGAQMGSNPAELYDVWNKVRWNAPAAMLLSIGHAPANTEHFSAVETRHTHIFTPMTHGQCHYWFGASRPKAMFSAEQVEFELSAVRGPFADEDAPMLAAQQQAFGDQDFWEARPIILREDAAAIRARRILDKRIRAEQLGIAAKANLPGSAVDEPQSGTQPGEEL